MALSRKAYITIIVLIIGTGIFLRSYHFSDWLHFELDQARDALVISEAYIEGPGELPLLGPKARGTFLRLGPLFYYSEYLSAKIFGNTPPGIAAVILIFSILSLPLFFIFCRRFFDGKISAILLLIYSISLFFIMYSRFAWNPNPLPFFILLFLYSLSKLSDENTNRGWWLVSASIALSYATQLHFLAFFVFPIFVCLFLIYKKPEIKLKYWLISLLAILILYSPVIINDVKTGGKNIKEFAKAISGKSEKGGNSMKQRLAVNFFEHSRYYFLSIISTSSDAFLSNKLNGEMRVTLRNDSTCGSDCKKSWTFGILGIIFFTWGSFLLFNRLRLEKKPKKDFLVICGLWLSITFGIFAPLASELSPRFFLLSFPLAFIFLGLILENIFSKSKYSYFAYLIILLLVANNFLEVKKRFTELASANNKYFKIQKDVILKEPSRVTYSQENEILSYMLEQRKINGGPIYYLSEAQYRPAFKYLLSRSDVQFDELFYRDIYGYGNFFYVVFSDPDQNWDTGKYASRYDIIGKKEFGTLTVLSLKPKAEFVVGFEKDFSQKEKEKKTGAPKRYKWNEVFNIKPDSEDTEDDDTYEEL